ncbi:hypothetical protein AAZX31_07G045000 [Glycine max]|uniref:Uncharacterized protein n=1 Tax=Glycine max TaxID=3847 RepID=I1KHK2_SOYBN|nr:putative mitochondrial potassium-hydrogen exchange transporter [Glycine max]KAG5021646.1 hypothetical protein JHK85_017988 [Glycine max]KAH1240640.1 hypothetical protein GmHk_07G018448 [Glycine max]KRH47727.1 hypothetical protein GLYMA_07G046600v4 [Glycine max]|eukprot:NP_001242857.2 putative mitochondrial potassium-hydrogen exchange transporter [Glycine max]
MRAKLFVFPIRGRNWCFSRTIDHSLSASHASSQSPSTLKDLWTNINVGDKPLNTKTELFVDYIANKMNNAWIGLEKAPEGSFKNKIHGLGLRLLSRVKPSEIFLKSISKEITSVEIIYPSSLNAQLVRRRLRHIAVRGAVIHRNYLYGLVSLIPLTSALSILPLPNVPFFWVLFRTYSHWRALQGSERLFQLVSDNSKTSNTCTYEKKTEHKESKSQRHSSNEPCWVLRPSKELENLVHLEDGQESLSQHAIINICKIYDLNPVDVIKYEKSVF